MSPSRFAPLFLVVTLAMAPSTLHAFGKKRPDPSAPKDSQAFPTRVLTFGNFLSTAFTLPDGKTKVDMSVVLPTLVLGEMETSQHKLRARAPDPVTGVPDPNIRYVLKGGITAFEANNFTHSVTIGFKPGTGDIGSGVLKGAEGKLTFNVGTLDMTFYIVDRQRSDEVVAVGRGSALTSGVALKVDLDFGVINGAADFVFNSPMAPHFKKAARDAILEMARDPNTNFYMDWSARVVNVNLDLKKFFFGAGGRDDIFPGNVFTVYDSNDMRLGEAKVQSAEHERSAASFKDDPNDKLIQSVRAGDTVKIFFNRAE